MKEKEKNNCKYPILYYLFFNFILFYFLRIKLLLFCHLTIITSISLIDLFNKLN